MKGQAFGSGLVVIVKKPENRDPLCVICDEYADTWVERKPGEKLPYCWDHYNELFADRVLHEENEAPLIWLPGRDF